MSEPSTEEGDGARADDAIATAWQIHAATIDWTKGVDSKASFVSALETAVLLGVIALAGGDRQLSDLHGRWQLGLFWAGVAIVVISLLIVLSVVTPHLRSRAAESEHSANFIYFGHVRHWTAENLEEALKTAPLLPVLSRQVVATSNIAWSKHRRLQVSVLGALGGTLLVGLAALMNFNGW